jgi:hypothetical protein
VPRRGQRLRGRRRLPLLRPWLALVSAED